MIANLFVFGFIILLTFGMAAIGNKNGIIRRP
jgi:hypothetical protein